MKTNKCPIYVPVAASNGSTSTENEGQTSQGGLAGIDTSNATPRHVGFRNKGIKSPGEKNNTVEINNIDPSSIVASEENVIFSAELELPTYLKLRDGSFELSNTKPVTTIITQQALQHLLGKPSRIRQVERASGLDVKNWLVSLLDRIVVDPACPWSFQYSAVRDAYYLKIYSKHSIDQTLFAAHLVFRFHKAHYRYELKTAYPFARENQIFLDNIRYEMLKSNEIESLGLDSAVLIESQTIQALQNDPGELTKAIAADIEYDDDYETNVPAETSNLATDQILADLMRRLKGFRQAVVRTEQAILQQKRAIEPCFSGLEQGVECTVQQAISFGNQLKRNQFESVTNQVIDALLIVEEMLSGLKELIPTEQCDTDTDVQDEVVEKYNMCREEYRDLMIAQGALIFPTVLMVKPVWDCLVGPLRGSFDTLKEALEEIQRGGSSNQDSQSLDTKMRVQKKALDALLTQYGFKQESLEPVGAERTQVPQDFEDKLKTSLDFLQNSLDNAARFTEYCHEWIECNREEFQRYLQFTDQCAEFFREIKKFDQFSDEATGSLRVRQARVLRANASAMMREGYENFAQIAKALNILIRENNQAGARQLLDQLQELLNKSEKTPFFDEARSLERKTLAFLDSVEPKKQPVLRDYQIDVQRAEMERAFEMDRLSLSYIEH